MWPCVLPFAAATEVNVSLGPPSAIIVAALHVWMPVLVENTEVGRLTVTNPRVVKSFLRKNWNIKNSIAGSSRILKR